MKLVYCMKCGDVFNLTYKYKECDCKDSGGFYSDRENAIYSGKYAVCLGLDNYSLAEGIENVPLDGKGVDLYSYVIPYFCDSTIKVDNSKAWYTNRTFANSNRINQEWLKKVKNVRIDNLFLKIIYKMFKKYIFISIKE